MKLRVTFTGYNSVVTTEVIRVYKVAPFGQPDGITEDIFTAKGQLIGASAASTPVAIAAAGVDGYVPIADSSQSSGIRWGTPTTAIDDNNNLAVNGGFDFAQRQTPGTDTTITDEKYGPDRWRCTRENASLQYSRQDASSETGLTSRYYGKFTKITSAGKFAVYQPLEFRTTIPLRGQSVLFQLQMKASSSKTIKIAVVELAAAGTADTLPAAFVTAWNVDSTDPTLGSNLAVVDSVQSCSVTTSWQTFSVAATVPSDSKNLILAVWSDADFSAADYLCLAEAGIYRGGTEQAWAPRLYDQELRLCQRFFSKSFEVDTAPAQNIGTNNSDEIFNATAAGANTNRTHTIRYPSVMRATPTITLYNPAAANAEVRDVNAGGDCSSSSTHNRTSNGFGIFCTGNGSTAVGNRLSIHWGAEAEL